mgnify:CR=1 FL=1
MRSAIFLWQSESMNASYKGIRIDIVGSNCVGKSTLISEVIGRTKAQHLDLAQFLGNLSDGWRTTWQQYKMILNSPSARRVCGEFVRKGNLYLARRYARYYFLHAMMLQAPRSSFDFVLIDEGAIKKLYEAVPFITPENYETERRRWIEESGHMQAFILDSIRDLTDVIIYMYVSPDEYMRRVRKREFFSGQIGEDRILARYQLQCEIYARLMKEAEIKGITGYSLKCENEGEMCDQLLDLLNARLNKWGEA